MLVPAPTELLPWLQQVYTKLCELNKQEHLAHAYLLQGPIGLGKLSLARYFGNYLLCQSPNNFQLCGECHSCQLIAAGTHPDLKIVIPEESKNIKIEQIRRTLEFMANTSQQGGRKVIIISPAEAMNNNATNALLKGLEEPSDGTLLLLISHQPSLLLATVRSRCQKIQFSCPDVDTAITWLESKQIRENVQSLLKLANGAPLRALQLADDDLLHGREILHTTLLELLKGKLGIVQAGSNCAESSIQDNIEGMMLCTFDLLAFWQSNQKHELCNGDLREIFLNLNECSSIMSLHLFYRELLTARMAINSTANPNPQLILESIFYQWSALATSLSDSDGIRKELHAI